MSLDGMEMLYSEINSTKKVNLGLYKITDINKARELLKKSYSGCFNQDIKLNNEQFWFICTSTYFGDIKSFYQVRQSGKTVYIYDVCTDKEQRNKGYFKLIFEYGLNFINQKMNNMSEILLDVLAIDNASSIKTEIPKEEEELSDFEEEDDFEEDDFEEDDFGYKRKPKSKQKSKKRVNLQEKHDEFNPELDDIVSLYSKFGFKIKGVKYEDNKFLIVMKYIKTNIELDLDTIRKKNLNTLNIYKGKNNMKQTTIGYNNFMELSSINKITNLCLRDYLNTIFRYSPNPSILTFLLDRCSDMTLYIPEKDIDKTLINHNIYFLWYFEQPEIRTYFISITNNINIESTNLLSNNILWLVSPMTNDYKIMLPTIIPHFYSVVLPFALNDSYFETMLRLVANMRYLETDNYSDICNVFNVKFKSVIFTKKIEVLPLFEYEDIDIIKNSRSIYMQELNGSETYYLNRAEIKLLKSLLEKDVEYGGAYGTTEFKYKDNETVSNLYTKELLIKGNKFGVNSPDGEINFHVHPNYCFSTEQLIVAWPSGVDFKSVSNIGSYFSSHTKTHLCVTTTGIFFIKLNPEFYNFIQTLTTNCKNILFNLVYIYFTNIEDLRHLEKINYFSAANDEAIIKFYEDVDKNKDKCISEIFSQNFNLIKGIIDEYLDKLKLVTLKTLLDFEDYNIKGLSQSTLLRTQQQLQAFIYELTTSISCESSIEAEKDKNYNLYNVTFANWETLLTEKYFQFK